MAAIQGAAAGLTTRDVALASAVHFGLPFMSEAHFMVYLNNTVRAQLDKLAREGLISTTQTSGPGLPTMCAHLQYGRRSDL